MRKKSNGVLAALMVFSQLQPIAVSATIINENENKDLSNEVTEAPNGEETISTDEGTVATTGSEDGNEKEEKENTETSIEDASTESISQEETKATSNDVSTTEAEVKKEENLRSNETTDSTALKEEDTIAETQKEQETTDLTIGLEETQEEQLTEVPAAATELPKEDFSSDSKKEAANAGETEIRIDTDSSAIITVGDESSAKTSETDTVVVDEENLTEEQLGAELIDEPKVTEINGDNFVIDEDGKIIASNETTFTTIGGYDHTSYMYATLEDAINKKNPTPINGGGFEGKYIKTVEKNNEYYAQIQISGFEGYISVNDIQIVPNGFEKAATYYANENGVWTMNVAIDPLTSIEYEKYPMATAPSWAKAGVKYYTYDDENFTTKTAANARGARAKLSASSYFQNLPFRSTSSYTAADYKKYLAYKGQTGSQYYNYTNGFTDAQKLKGVNSLWIFANANHESAYGTSSYARACDNYFGRGAFDSNPDNACSSGFWWTSPRDSILAQSYFLAQTYGDNGDWVYFGTHPGNKQDGVNAVYASDPLWGAKMGSHMYSVDSYLGGKEEGKYRIYAINSSQKVYKNSSLTSKLQMQGYGTPNGSTPSDYVLSRNLNTGYGQTSYARPRVVVTQDTSKSFKFQLDTPINNDSSRYIGFNTGKNGSYPNFEGNIGGAAGSWYSNYVPTGMVNFAANYGTNWAKQQAWYPKYTSTGNATFSVLNDVTAKSPSQTTTNNTVNDVKPTIKTSAKTVSLKNGKLYIEGIGYLRGVSSPNTTDIKQYLKLKDYSTGKQVKTFNLSSKKNASAMNQFETDGRQYDGGYFTTPNSNGLNLTSIVNGKYKIKLSAISTKNSAFTDEEYLYPGTMKNKSKTMYYGGRKYVIAGNDKELILTISNINDVKPTIRTSARKAWMKGTKLHIEGVGYLRGVNTSQTPDIQHSLKFANYSSGKTTKVYNVGASKRPSELNKYETDGRQYDAGYFATYGYKGIDINNLPVGKYKVYLEAYSTKNKKNIDNEWLSAGSLNGKYYTSYACGKKFEIYSVNNRIVVEVRKESEIKTSLAKSWLKGSVFHIEGAAFLNGVNTTDYASLSRQLKLYNYGNGKLVKSYNVYQSKKPSYMNKYEKGNVQYDAAYFATKSYDGINLKTLPDGKYKVYIKATETKGAKRHGEEWLYSSSLKKPLVQKANGKTYKLYSENNRLIIQKY